MTKIKSNRIFQAALLKELSDAELKKRIRKEINYIKKIAKEGFC